MIHIRLLLAFSMLVLRIAGIDNPQTRVHPYIPSNTSVFPDTLTLVDSTRNRSIPVAVYKQAVLKSLKDTGVIIFSHGYGQNAGGTYLNYSYLTNYLAAQGYFVVSIQHELGTDSLIPSTGIPQVVRRPFWESGAENIRFVIDHLRRTNPGLDYNRITLIGHSNGGDIASLYIEMYPGLIDKIITLDNRRMPLPKTKEKPKVYSLRSSDQPADEGVLPDAQMQKQLGIRIIKLQNIIHNDMDDRATTQQKDEINRYVLSFLQD